MIKVQLEPLIVLWTFVTPCKKQQSSFLQKPSVTPNPLFLKFSHSLSGLGNAILLEPLFYFWFAVMSEMTL